LPTGRVQIKQACKGLHTLAAWPPTLANCTAGCTAVLLPGARVSRSDFWDEQALRDCMLYPCLRCGCSAPPGVRSAPSLPAPIPPPAAPTQPHPPPPPPPPPLQVGSRRRARRFVARCMVESNHRLPVAHHAKLATSCVHLLSVALPTGSQAQQHGASAPPPPPPAAAAAMKPMPRPLAGRATAGAPPPPQGLQPQDSRQPRSSQSTGSASGGHHSRRHGDGNAGKPAAQASAALPKKAQPVAAGGGSGGGALQPQQQQLQQSTLDARLRRETPFLATIRFKNDLPEVPGLPVGLAPLAFVHTQTNASRTHQ
jgi:hypothetical protein